MTTVLITHPSFLNHDTGQYHPERLEIVTSMPTTLTGKIQKFMLRADLKARLAAEQTSG